MSSMTSNQLDRYVKAASTFRSSSISQEPPQSKYDSLLNYHSPSPFKEPSPQDTTKSGKNTYKSTSITTNPFTSHPPPIQNAPLRPPISPPPPPHPPIQPRPPNPQRPRRRNSRRRHRWRRRRRIRSSRRWSYCGCCWRSCFYHTGSCWGAATAECWQREESGRCAEYYWGRGAYRYMRGKRLGV